MPREKHGYLKQKGSAADDEAGDGQVALKEILNHLLNDYYAINKITRELEYHNHEEFHLKCFNSLASFQRAPPRAKI
jgi:hypothetical protein